MLLDHFSAQLTGQLVMGIQSVHFVLVDRRDKGLALGLGAGEREIRFFVDFVQMADEIQNP